MLKIANEDYIDNLWKEMRLVLACTYFCHWTGHNLNTFSLLRNENQSVTVFSSVRRKYIYVFVGLQLKFLVLHVLTIQSYLFPKLIMYSIRWILKIEWIKMIISWHFCIEVHELQLLRRVTNCENDCLENYAVLHIHTYLCVMICWGWW